MDDKSKAIIRLAIPEDIAAQISTFLLSRSPLEEGVFCLLHQGKGHSGIRLLASELILPPTDAWEYQEEAILRPSARWISAVISRAITTKSGLLFIHSHPDPDYPMGFSYSDQSAFVSLAQTITPMLDGLFAAVVVHPNGWTGSVWINENVAQIHKIISAGRILKILSPLPKYAKTTLDSRQEDALGIVHSRLRSLTIAVVGCGGIGSSIAEQLARMGVDDIILIDHDVLDTESNIRRVSGSTIADLSTRPYPLKVKVISKFIEKIGLGTHIRQVAGDVRLERVFRHLLDADIVLNATDTHGSRAIINELPSKYILPVIDVGVRVGSKTHNKISGLLAEVRILTHITPCLWCRKTIDGDIIREENLPEHERKKLAEEGYLVGNVGEPAPSVIALTTLASGLCTCALIALLSEEGEVGPSGYWIDGFLGDSQETRPMEPVPGCWCRRNIAVGDMAAPSFIVDNVKQFKD